MKNIYFLLLLILSIQFGYSQIEHPDDGILFADDIVSRIDITISQDNLDQILAEENLNLNVEYPATFVFTQGSIRDTVENVGFRLRGNTSRQSSKPSFKVSFNTFDSGRKYRDVEKLNLNGEHNDPTIARSKISWEVMADQGIPASRTNHVELYINETYRGLYLNVEHIDEEFLKKRFEDWSGNLYKCLWPADLTYISENANDYKVNQFGRRTYDLKTNKEQDDYSDIANLIDVINKTPTNELPCELESIFDIQSYLKLVAVDILIGNWDGHLFNKNNFYLYHDPCTDKFMMMPYDLDNTFGIDWFDVDWSTSSIDYWVENHAGSRPLIDRLVSIPKYRRNIEDYLITLKNHWESLNYQETFYALRDSLSPYREEDLFASLDYGFTLNDFKSNYTHGLSYHVTQGLVEFMDSRLNSLSLQLDTGGQQVPAVEYYTQQRSETSIDLTFTIQFMDVGKEVILHYKHDDENWTTQIISASQDNLYSISIPHPAEDTQTLSWYLSLKYGIAGVSRYPTCESITTRINPISTPPLVINEVVSSNTSGVQDEFGEFPDWIELYNNGNEIISLDGLYLTDKKEILTMWKLPNYTIEPDSYLIIYADDDGHQGPLHANFKLNKDGEYLALIDSKSNLNAIIDSITVPTLDSDLSYGRSPNGIGGFIELPFQSPDRNNESLSSNQLIENTTTFTLSPNPVINFLTINSTDKGVFRIYTSAGLCLKTRSVSNNEEIFDLSNLSQGIYIVSFTNLSGNTYTEKLVKY